MNLETPPTVPGTERLVDLAARKCECLVQLGDLAHRQLEYIASGDMSQLLQLLATKQRLLAELGRIEAGLDPFRHQEPQERTWASPEQRQRCSDLLDRSAALFGELIALERQGEDCLRRRRDQAAARLKETHAPGHARSACTPRQAPAARIDLTSER